MKAAALSRPPSPPLPFEEDPGLTQAHQQARPSYQVDRGALPGWHVGYCGLRGLCREHTPGMLNLSNRVLLTHILHRPEESPAVLAGMEAYRKEVQLQLQKVLSKTETPHRRK